MLERLIGDHKQAGELLRTEGTKVEFLQINPGKGMTPSEMHNVLRYYEQREFDKVSTAGEGYEMVNKPGKRIQAKNKKEMAKDLIEKHGVTEEKMILCPCK